MADGTDVVPNIPINVLNDIYTASPGGDYKICRECRAWIGTRHGAFCKLGWLEWAHRQLRDGEPSAISAFFARVNKRAEADIERGNPITGAHHRALIVEEAAVRGRQT
jgi:hypothetical protein